MQQGLNELPSICQFLSARYRGYTQQVGVRYRSAEHKNGEFKSDDARQANRRQRLPYVDPRTLPEQREDESGDPKRDTEAREAEREEKPLKHPEEDVEVGESYRVRDVKAAYDSDGSLHLQPVANTTEFEPVEGSEQTPLDRDGGGEAAADGG